jgi:type II secretion system protein L
MNTAINGSTTIFALRRESDELRLWRAGRASVPVDLETESIQDEWVLAAPADRVRMTRLAVKPDERRHLAQSLPFMLEDEVVEPVEALHFAYGFLDDQHCWVAVTSRSDMDDWLSSLGPEQQSVVVNEALLLPWQPGEVCMVVEAGSVVVRYGEFQGARIDHEMVEVFFEAMEVAPIAIVIYGAEQVADTRLIPAGLADRVQWRQGDFGTALMLTPSVPTAFNLRQGGYAPRLPLQRWWQFWRTAIFALGLALLLQLGSDWLQVRQLSEENTALRRAIQDSFRRVNPRGAIVDAEKQLDRQLAEFAVGDAALAFIPALEKLTRTIASVSGVSISSINFSATAGEVRLDVSAPNYEAIESLRTRLQDEGFENDLETSSQRNQRVRARLRVRAS